MKCLKPPKSMSLLEYTLYLLIIHHNDLIITYDYNSLFSKNNAHKTVDTEISPKDTINQNAIWFQSMEPITYAKNQTKELYEINDTNSRQKEN